MHYFLILVLALLDYIYLFKTLALSGPCNKSHIQKRSAIRSLSTFKKHLLQRK